MIAELCRTGDRDGLIAIAAAGAIPALVQLMGPGVQQNTVAALSTLIEEVDNAADIAIAAGAVHRLVQLA
jgi:hypothetical protein